MQGSDHRWDSNWGPQRWKAGKGITEWANLISYMCTVFQGGRPPALLGKCDVSEKDLCQQCFPIFKVGLTVFPKSLGLMTFIWIADKARWMHNDTIACLPAMFFLIHPRAITWSFRPTLPGEASSSASNDNKTKACNLMKINDTSPKHEFYNWWKTTRGLTGNRQMVIHSTDHCYYGLGWSLFQQWIQVTL